MSNSSCRFIAALTMALLPGVSTLPAQVASPAGQVVTPVAETAPRAKIVLVELFTSEGCSSCPPADALLSKVNQTRTAAGQLIVGISEHVTYWNSLGWADPFSSPKLTERQSAYAASLGLDSVYTPQMVVNGRQQFVGSDSRRLEQAIRNEQGQPSPVDVRILSTSIAGGSLTVTFSADGDASVHDADVIAVLADDADQSSVLRGENSGRNLAHVAVARTVVHIAKVHAMPPVSQQPAPQQTVEIQLPPSFRGKPGHHLILFAQAHGNGRVLGADTRPL